MTSDGVKCYQINEANQIDKVTNCSSGQTIAEYVYDYMGMRMVKRNFTNGTLANTVTSWSDSYETKVIVGGATENTAYYFANGQLLAKKDNSGMKTYIHSDHLGSTSLITDQSGALVENTAYDPWGKVKSGGVQNKFMYTGQEHDSETKLHYYNARYYDPHIRRFTQPDDMVQDVYDPQSLNRYSYVNNNPLTYTDPTGHVAVVPVILIGAGVGAFAGVADVALTNIDPQPMDWVMGGVKGAGAGAVTSLAAVGLGAPVTTGLAAAGVSSAVRPVASDMIVGGLISSFQSIANNRNTSNPFKDVPQSFVKGSITGGIAGAAANKIVPQTAGRPSEKLSVWFNGSKSVQTAQRTAVNQIIERMTIPYAKASYLSVGGKPQPSKAQAPRAKQVPNILKKYMRYR